MGVKNRTTVSWGLCSPTFTSLGEHHLVGEGSVAMTTTTQSFWTFFGWPSKHTVSIAHDPRKKTSLKTYDFQDLHNLRMVFLAKHQARPTSWLRRGYGELFTMKKIAWTGRKDGERTNERYERKSGRIFRLWLHLFLLGRMIKYHINHLFWMGVFSVSFNQRSYDDRYFDVRAGAFFWMATGWSLIHRISSGFQLMFFSPMAIFLWDSNGFLTKVRKKDREWFGMIFKSITMNHHPIHSQPFPTKKHP